MCAVLTGAEDAGEASKVLALGGYGHVDCVAVDTLLEQGHTPDAGDWRPPAVHGHDPALLQYTSGSTQVPRGVVIQHRHLLANQAAIRRALGTGPDSVFGGWLPLHHDMGLIGQLLHPLFLGATAVVMTPEAFVRDPGRWPRMVAEHGVQVSGAPNFGYQLVVDRVRDRDLAGLDLSGWEIAVNGGEPVRASTMRAFQDRFGRHGLRPGALRSAYGLAEATLMVSVSGPGGAQATLDVDRGELERGGCARQRRARPNVACPVSARSGTCRCGSSIRRPSSRSRTARWARSGCAARASGPTTGAARRGPPAPSTARSTPAARTGCAPGTWGCCTTASSTSPAGSAS
ncbi:AMP-binding protein [Catenulispora yoronensis]